MEGNPSFSTDSEDARFAAPEDPDDVPEHWPQYLRRRPQRGPRVISPLIEWDGSHIKRYNVKRIFRWYFTAMTTVNGTVLHQGMLPYALINFVLALIGGYFRCPTKPPPSSPEWTFCFPTLAVSEGIIFASLASLMMSAFCTLTFGRWWEVRQRIQSIMTKTYEVAALLALFARGPDARNVAARQGIMRYLHLAHALLYKEESQDQTGQEFIDRHLMTGDEWQVLQHTPGRFHLVYSWAGELLHQCVLQGVVTDKQAERIDAVLATLRASGNDIHPYIHSQLPFAYIHLVNLVGKIHLAFVTCYCAGFIGLGLEQKVAWRIIIGAVIIFTHWACYHGLLEIHGILSNPLGNDPGDFPRYWFQDRLEMQSQAILDGADAIQFENFFAPSTLGKSSSARGALRTERSFYAFPKNGVLRPRRTLNSSVNFDPDCD